MSENQDLKSKILTMRQKNFGEVINSSEEKNDNKTNGNKKELDQINQKNEKANFSKNENNDNEKKIVNSELELDNDTNEYIVKLNEIAKTNEKAFNLLAGKFNESVEVILELTHRVEKLETIVRLQSMQEKQKDIPIKNNKSGLRFFIFLIFLASISYFFYKYEVDMSVIKEIGQDFISILKR